MGQVKPRIQGSQQRVRSLATSLVGLGVFVSVGVALFEATRAMLDGPNAALDRLTCQALWYGPAVLFSVFADLALAAVVGGGVATFRTRQARWVLLAIPCALGLGGIAFLLLVGLALTGDSGDCWR